MKPFSKEIKGAFGKDCKIFARNAEPEAVQMVRDYLDNPHSAGSRIRIMPDMHLGKGIVIGFTGQMGTHVNPAHIGLDIGCGIDTQLFDRKLDEKDYSVFEHRIRKEIPVGQDINRKSQFEMKGVYSTSINPDTIDESPSAYKPTQEILESLPPTCRVHYVLKSKINIKG